MKDFKQKLSFAADYMEGAHPSIIQRLEETNLIRTPGYGLDAFSDSARDKIRRACDSPDAEVYFMVGGTQTNVTVIDALLKSYQGVIAAESGHISVHEAGAIEFGGHKVLTVPHKLGKLSSSDIETVVAAYQNDANREHMVMPGMVYISQPTEYGTLYSLQELTEISRSCRRHKLPLYLDGARLAYGLASPDNDVTLSDIARLCDVFYIGGTKCGALFGEAVVIPQKGFIPHFFTIIKQHGALLAKGRLLGLQFDALFTDGLYCRIGRSAVDYAGRIQDALKQANLPLYFSSPTNQVFAVLEDRMKEELESKVELGFWEKYDKLHTVVRFATSWATSEEDVNQLLEILAAYNGSTR